MTLFSRFAFEAENLFEKQRLPPFVFGHLLQEVLLGSEAFGLAHKVIDCLGDDGSIVLSHVYDVL